MEHPTEPARGNPILIELTPRAVEQVKAAMQREGVVGYSLRVGVTGGGCSGMQYHLGFEAHPSAEDTVLEFDGVRVLIDPTSARYLKGVTLDYVAALHGGGFKFFNPNAQRTCGCGSSFSA